MVELFWIWWGGFVCQTLSYWISRWMMRGHMPWWENFMYSLAWPLVYCKAIINIVKKDYDDE